jgi:pyridoxal phosphate enzyme (YggS family)
MPLIGFQHHYILISPRNKRNGNAMIATSLEDILNNIKRAATEDGRRPEDVTLIAVSKKQAEDRIEEALAAGIRVFGENRVQEAQSRWNARRATCADLKLHLIGPLQTNKAEDAVALFDVIESLDREKLAASLAKAMQKLGVSRECLIQVNTGEEEQKAGISPVDAITFSHYCRDHYGLNITGMMCIPPADEEPAMHFALLKKLAVEAGLPRLSMGMSGDYETAIKFGATQVRIGSSLLGERTQ